MGWRKNLMRDSLSLINGVAKGRDMDEDDDDDEDDGIDMQIVNEVLGLSSHESEEEGLESALDFAKKERLLIVAAILAIFNVLILKEDGY